MVILKNENKNTKQILWIHQKNFKALCAKMGKPNTGMAYKFIQLSFPHGVHI